ncbi:hypothetical protein PR048_028637 [Dryococelus australis]|uniref:Uncharacterized protein n=1 Tax=Dryococelus australis TaxID=614101 RepID=A0ABQ9GB46_9NEOP|nr:hypothetical protein PR048_028637 [Dryococelus australis]
MPRQKYHFLGSRPKKQELSELKQAASLHTKSTVWLCLYNIITTCSNNCTIRCSITTTYCHLALALRDVSFGTQSGEKNDPASVRCDPDLIPGLYKAGSQIWVNTRHFLVGLSIPPNKCFIQGATVRHEKESVIRLQSANIWHDVFLALYTVRNIKFSEERVCTCATQSIHFLRPLSFSFCCTALLTFLRNLVISHLRHFLYKCSAATRGCERNCKQQNDSSRSRIPNGGVNDCLGGRSVQGGHSRPSANGYGPPRHDQTTTHPPAPLFRRRQYLTNTTGGGEKNTPRHRPGDSSLRCVMAMEVLVYGVEAETLNENTKSGLEPTVLPSGSPKARHCASSPEIKSCNISTDTPWTFVERRLRNVVCGWKQSSDTLKTPYDRVKRGRKRKIIRASERVNVEWNFPMDQHESKPSESFFADVCPRPSQQPMQGRKNALRGRCTNWKCSQNPHKRGGGTVAERFARSPTTKANRVQSRFRHRIFASGNRAGRCRWSAGFLGDLQFPSALSFRRCSILTSIPSSALKASLLRASGTSIRSHATRNSLQCCQLFKLTGSSAARIAKKDKGRPTDERQTCGTAWIAISSP